jgi:hypothetical protein
MQENPYARAIMERMGDAWEISRHALCASPLETYIFDTWCIAAAPAYGLARKINATRNMRGVHSARGLSIGSVHLMRQLMWYDSERTRLDRTTRSLPRGQGERVVERFDREMISRLSLLTDPLLYRLAGVSAPDPMWEWTNHHRGLSVDASGLMGEKAVDRLVYQMKREGDAIEYRTRLEAERERAARHMGLPGMGRYIR